MAALMTEKASPLTNELCWGGELVSVEEENSEDDLLRLRNMMLDGSYVYDCRDLVDYDAGGRTRVSALDVLMMLTVLDLLREGTREC